MRGDVHLAYQVAGSGPPDIVFVGGSMATTLAWEEHATAKGFRRLASFSRLVTYDQRGTGYSDRFDPSDAPTLDDLVGDLAAVIDAAGVTDPSSSARTTAARSPPSTPPRHPVRQLVLCNTWARLQVADDFPIGSATRSSTTSKSATGPSGGRGASQLLSSPRPDDRRPPGASSWRRPAATSR